MSESMVRIVSALPPDHNLRGFTEWALEVIFATPMGNDTFRVENIPSGDPDINLHDVVFAGVQGFRLVSQELRDAISKLIGCDDSFICICGIAQRSGQRTFSVTGTAVSFTEMDESGNTVEIPSRSEEWAARKRERWAVSGAETRTNLFNAIKDIGGHIERRGVGFHGEFFFGVSIAQGEPELALVNLLVQGIADNTIKEYVVSGTSDRWSRARTYH